jgi:hypothetical protein
MRRADVHLPERNTYYNRDGRLHLTRIGSRVRDEIQIPLWDEVENRVWDRIVRQAEGQIYLWIWSKEESRNESIEFSHRIDQLLC